jgi:hypothetical protein
MTYADLIQLYFERSSSLQWYWTIYVVVIGGLLAFSSLRQRGDLITLILVSTLYAFFAYKNLGAIGDVVIQRNAVVRLINETPPNAATPASIQRQRELLEPTLIDQTYESVRNFHIASDMLTIAALWAMEWRRIRASRESKPREPRGPETSTSAAAPGH